MVTNAAAARVASTIGAMKWVIIAAQIITGVILMLAINSAETWPSWTAVLAPAAIVSALLSAVFTWVLFGWFQHTLGMLAAIAGHQADGSGTRA